MHSSYEKKRSIEKAFGRQVIKRFFQPQAIESIYLESIESIESYLFESIFESIAN